MIVKPDEVYRLKLERLRYELLAGERSGPAREFDFDGFLAEVEEEAYRCTAPDDGATSA